MSQISPPTEGEQGFVFTKHEEAQEWIPHFGSWTKPALPVVLLRLVCLLPTKWVEDVLNRTQKASQRVRRMPAQFVLWLVILLALFREQSIYRVAKNLDLALRASRDIPLTRSALVQALARLGPEPVEHIFRRSAVQWAIGNTEVCLWRGLYLFVVDGTTFRTQDTPENRDEFGGQRYVSGLISPYPQVRCVSLMSLGTRIVTGVKFGPYKINEMTYAGNLISEVPNFSLVVFDKGFLSSRLLEGLREFGDERHFLIPVKRGMTGTILPGGSPVDYQLEMKVTSQARKNAPWLPKTWTARVIVVRLPDGRTRALLTSLLDVNRYPAEEVAALYKRRWEAESALLEIKQFLLGGTRTLRSKSPAGVVQELWGTFTAYNLLRLRMAEDAKGSRFRPTDLSPTGALDMLKHDLIQATPLCGERRKQHWLAAPIEKRPGREYPRQVKSIPSRYPVVRAGKRLPKPYPQSKRRRIRHRKARKP